jgi:DNA-binding SARP family transcriptional activator
MAHLSIATLGTLQITLDGQPITGAAYDKVWALLVYLALALDRPHRREALAGMLWPDQPEEVARTNLRQALARLRQAIDDHHTTPPFLLVERESIQFNAASDHTVDVAHFRRLLKACRTHGHRNDELCVRCVDPLSQAAALCSGDFLAGFSLGDSPDFEEWQFFQSEGLRQDLASVLERLVTWHISQRAWEQAVGYAQRWVALDPLHEPAQRRLMQLYAWAGRRAAALRQYRTCARFLHEELGALPSYETTRLAEAIQTRSVPEPEGALPPPIAAVPVRTQPPGQLPPESSAFVARELEMARLEGFLAQALAGQGQVVFVTGEAGSGKTLLLQEFIRRALAAHLNLIVAGANCNAFTGAGDPYLPFREVLGQLAGDFDADGAGLLPPLVYARRRHALAAVAAPILLDHGPDLVGAFVPQATLQAHATNGARQQLAELSARNAANSGMLNQEQICEQATHVLLTLAAHRPLLLLVDDLQWADAASVGLLFHLARRIDTSRILLIGAYRPQDIALGRSGQRHPLVSVVNELRRYAGDIRIDLDHASETSGADFVNALLDSRPNRLDAAFQAALFQQTEGHPLFTVELLRGLQERGDLVQDADGCWVEGVSVDWETLPARVEGVIAEQVDRIEEALQEALAIASVEGEVFTAEVVARVQGVETRAMLRRLSEELDRGHHLVHAVAATHAQGRRLSRYRFRHFLFQRYLYRRLDSSERPYLHEEVGDALEALYGEQREALAVPLARHFAEAGQNEKAVQSLLLAVQSALRLSAYQETIAQCRRGLALLATLPDTSERVRTELGYQLALATALQAVEGYAAPAAEHAYERALALCRQIDDLPDTSPQFVLALLGLGLYFFARSSMQTAQELGERVLAMAERIGDPTLSTAAHWLLGVSLVVQGKLAPALAHLVKVNSLAGLPQHHALTYALDLNLRVACLVGSAVIAWLLGFPDQSAELIAKALAGVEAVAHPMTTVSTFAQLAMVHYFRRDVDATLHAAQRAVNLVSQYSFPYWVAGAMSFHGWAQAQLGQYQTGIEEIQQAIAWLHTAETGQSLPLWIGLLAEACAQTGQIEEGLHHLAEAIDLADATGVTYVQAEHYRLKGELLLALEDGLETEAEEALHQAIAVAQQQEAKMFELRATVSLCRLWQRQGKTAEACQMLAAILSWFTEGFDTPDLLQATTLLDTLAH